MPYSLSLPLEPASETSMWSPVWKQIHASRGEMGACPSDVAGFRFYEEYDLEKGTPVSAGCTLCYGPPRIPPANSAAWPRPTGPQATSGRWAFS